MLLLLLACTATEPEDTAAATDGGAETTDDGGSTDDGGTTDGGGEDTGGSLTWTGLAACSNLRLLATDGDRELAMELDLDTYTAATIGDPVEASLEAGAQYVLLLDEVAPGDVCGSIEEFPPFGSSTPYWRATAGSIQVRFEPDTAWGFDNPAFWDGTELGTVSLTAADLVLEPQATASGTVELSTLDFSVRLTMLDLPAR